MARRDGANSRTQKRRKRRATGARARGVAQRVLRLSVVGGPLLVLAVAAVYGVRMSGSWMRSSERFRVKTVEVRGALRLDTAQVITQAGIAAGVNLLDIKPDKIRESLMNNPVVERVRVHRWMPGKIRLDVVERTPIALVSVGRVYQVDESGVLFDAPRGTYVTVPVISGLRDTLDGSGLRRLTPASHRRMASVRAALSSSDAGWIHQLSQIDLSQPDIVRLRIEGCPAAVTVSSDSLASQMKRLERLLEVLVEDGRTDVRTIDLSLRTVAYVRHANGVKNGKNPAGRDASGW